MTQVYIQCDNQAMVYDLENWKLVDKTDNCLIGALIRCSKPESIQVESLVSREILSDEALKEYNSNTLSIEYFGNVKTGKQGIHIFK